jgi:hypothetical protein
LESRNSRKDRKIQIDKHWECGKLKGRVEMAKCSIYQAEGNSGHIGKETKKIIIIITIIIGSKAHC